MKALLEYGPLAIFFIFYKVFDIYWGTGALMASAVVCLAITYHMEKTISKRILIMYGFVIFAGALTLFFRDDAFLKWKVTVIYCLFGMALIVTRYMFNNNLIKKGLQEQLELPDFVWDRLNIAWSILCFSLAAANVYVAFNMPLETWVNFKVFGITGITFVFAFVCIMFIYKYLPEEDEENEAKPDAVSSAQVNASELSNEK